MKIVISAVRAVQIKLFFITKNHTSPLLFSIEHDLKQTLNGLPYVVYLTIFISSFQFFVFNMTTCKIRRTVRTLAGNPASAAIYVAVPL